MSTEREHQIRRRGGSGPWLALMLSCLALVVIDRSLVPDAQLALGANHLAVVEADVSSRLHELPGAEPRLERLRLRRTDEVLVTSGDVAVVQSTLAWVGTEGRVPLSQTTGLYGVARRDRQNVSGFGDQERDGWFEPPPDPPRDRLVLWDAFHPGRLGFRFENIERHEGVDLWRYQLATDGSDDVDDSATFDQLPLVPERYRIVTRVTQAWLLLEPRTGRVIDRQQDSISRFVSAVDGTSLGEAHQVSWRYSADDRSRLLAALRHDLRLLWLVEQGMPFILLLIALLAGVVAILRWRTVRLAEPQGAPS